MQAELVVFLFVLLAGFAAFGFGVVYFLITLLTGLGRGILRICGIGRSRRVPQAPGVSRGRVLVCPHPRCGHRETRRDARRCCQCGTRLIAGFQPESGESSRP